MQLSLGTNGSFARLDAELNEAIVSQLLLINREQGQIPKQPECMRRLLITRLSFKRMELIFHENRP